MIERQRESARKSWELVEQLYSWVEEVLALKSTTIIIKCQVEKKNTESLLAKGRVKGELFGKRVA